MAIAHRASTTVEANSTAAIVNNVPAGTTNGDLLIWRHSNTTTTVTATPAGWTLLVSSTATATMQVIWWRIAASEPASYTTGALTAGRAIGIMSAFSGVDTTTPFDVATPAMVAGTTATTSAAITPITTGAWVLGFGDANVASGVINTTFSSGNLTAIDAQKTSTQAAATNNVGATGHFVWTSGAFTPTWTTSNASVRTLGATAALRPSAGTTTAPFHARAAVNRVAVMRASTF